LDYPSNQPRKEKINKGLNIAECKHGVDMLALVVPNLVGKNCDSSLVVDFSIKVSVQANDLYLAHAREKCVQLCRTATQASISHNSDDGKP
jgi:hypothetical protein